MDQEARKHFLARMFGQKEQPSAATEATHQSAVLVVDDSRTVTIALQRILESAFAPRRWLRLLPRVPTSGDRAYDLDRAPPEYRPDGPTPEDRPLRRN